MHRNVAVWLCHMYPSCDSHSIQTCERNADYARRALAWSKICQHLYIWHYIVDFCPLLQSVSELPRDGRGYPFLPRTSGSRASTCRG